MKKLKNPVKTVNWICALLMALLLILHVTPFWSVEGEGISLLDYWCFPDDHSNLTSWLDDSLGGFDISEIVFWILFIVIFCVVGIYVGIKNREKVMGHLVPAGIGFLGILFCICEPAFRMGQVWVLHLILYLALLVLPAISLAARAKGVTEDAK